MTTAELVKALAERLGVSQVQARSLLDGYVTAIKRQLEEKNTVILRNFGSFSVKDVPQKRSYLPAKASVCLIPAHQKLHFKAAKGLKDEVSEEGPHE